MPGSTPAPACDSVEPLLQLAAPILFVTSDHDELCSGSSMRGLGPRLKVASSSVLLLELQVGHGAGGMG